MGYSSLAACVADLEQHRHLVRIKEEVDPYLEMAAIHMRVFDAEGPALFFENIKGSKFPAVSNLFGTLDRSRFMFRDTLDHVKKLVDVKMNVASGANCRVASSKFSVPWAFTEKSVFGSRAAQSCDGCAAVWTINLISAPNFANSASIASPSRISSSTCR